MVSRSSGEFVNCKRGYISKCWFCQAPLDVSVKCLHCSAYRGSKDILQSVISSIGIFQVASSAGHVSDFSIALIALCITEAGNIHVL